MATTVNTDLVIYDDLAQTAFLERRQDNLEVFNASSNGAILLDNELIEGDFRKRAFYKVGGSIESRNVNSVDKVTGKKIGAGEAVPLPSLRRRASVPTISTIRKTLRSAIVLKAW